MGLDDDNDALRDIGWDVGADGPALIFGLLPLVELLCCGFGEPNSSLKEGERTRSRSEKETSSGRLRENWKSIQTRGRVSQRLFDSSA
jgi:hypothetical protein